MRPRTAAMLADVATVYRAAVTAGRSPVDAVAARFDVTYEAAKRRIYRARRAGMDLTPRRERTPA